MKLSSKTIIASCAAAMAISFSSCRKNIDVAEQYAYVPFSTECISVPGDGTEILRVWGQGKDKSEAIDMAMRNAVNDVLFKGVSAGAGQCDKRPVMLEVNARERYTYYFDPFFAKKGAYTKFVTLHENRTSRIKAQSTTLQAYGVVVSVNRSALRQQLITDGILKP